MYRLSIVFGSVFMYGNINPYFVSYIRERSYPSDLRYKRSTYMFSCQFSVCAIGLLLGGVLEKSLGLRMVMLSAALLCSIGLLLSFIVVHYSFWWLLIFFGISGYRVLH